MCGVFGIVSTAALTEPPELLSGLTDVLAHRGPNARGEAHLGHVFLGHRRLSVIDIKRSAQPMWSPCERLVLVYNGEIYNFRELREILSGLGHVFRTAGDTEVVLAAYAQWGEACLARLRGMFALAVWDATEAKLFLARDQLGIKPLYYATLGERLIFASEMKAIVRHPEFPRAANLKSISSYLSFRTVIGDETVFAGLKSLPPGHCLTWKTGRTRLRQYWDIPFEPRPVDRGEDYTVNEARELWHSTVAAHLVSDVPVGAYLSGGLDSSLMVAAMARQRPDHLRTYSIGFDVPGYDESAYAELVSEHCGTRHTAVHWRADDYLARLETAIMARDAPLSIPHEVALRELSFVIQRDVTVCLSGEGADEIFGGYGRVQRSPMDYAKAQWFQRLPELGRNLLRRCMLKPEFAARLACRGEVDHLCHVYHWWDIAAKRLILSGDAWRHVDGDQELMARIQSLFDHRSAGNAYDRVFYFFQKVHLVNLLERLDIQSMAASVEARVPYVDQRIVEFAARLPLDYKLRWKSPWHRLRGVWTASERASGRLDIPKYLLRRLAEAELPTAIARREKLGFPVPLNAWFSGALRDFAKEILLDERTRARGLFDSRQLDRWLAAGGDTEFDFHGKLLWMLLNVELWLRTQIDGPPLPLNTTTSTQALHLVPSEKPPKDGQAQYE